MNKQFFASLTLLGAMSVAGCECDDPLTTPSPRLVVNPEEVDLTGAPVGDDTIITINVENPSSIPNQIVDICLREPGTDTLDCEVATADPAFEIVKFITDQTLLASQLDTIEIKVRPLLVSTLRTELVIIAEDDSLPNVVVVPIAVQAINLGLPDIEVDPERVDFGRVGALSVAREFITVRNVGNRELIIDNAFIIHLDPDDTSFRVNESIVGQIISPGDEVQVQVTFQPPDTNVHKAELHIESNDLNEPVIIIGLIGLGSECPVAVAELLDDPAGLEPLDTVRIDGHNSEASSAGADIEGYEWTLNLRPQGSTSVLETTDDERTQITCDIAGDYEVRLQVTDTDGVGSCNDALIQFSCLPTEDLHLQLVWDHPTADLDLHLLQEGGTPFTHETDCYFSNRRPEWFPLEENNPTLDQDDNRGYGPENINVITPAPGSRWDVLVHYWNAQTDGDAFVNATLRIYARGQLVANLTQTFDGDQQMWTAAEIVWSEDEEEQPTINFLNTLDPFARPF